MVGKLILNCIHNKTNQQGAKNKMKVTYSTTIELPFASIYFKKEGYIHLHFKNHSTNLEESKKLFATVRKNSPWEKCPFLISGEDFSSQDKESKAFNTSAEISKHMSAQAFIVSNSIQKITVNFFVKMFKPAVPLKIFTNEAAAIQWLMLYVPNNTEAKKQKQ